MLKHPYRFVGDFCRKYESKGPISAIVGEIGGRTPFATPKPIAAKSVIITEECEFAAKEFFWNECSLAAVRFFSKRALFVCLSQRLFERKSTPFGMYRMV